MDKATIIRLIVMLLAWINAFLAEKGINAPVIGEETVSLGVAFAISLWTAWKDNPISRKAIENEKYLKEKGLK